MVLPRQTATSRDRPAAAPVKGAFPFKATPTPTQPRRTQSSSSKDKSQPFSSAECPVRPDTRGRSVREGENIEVLMDVGGPFTGPAVQVVHCTTASSPMDE